MTLALLGVGAVGALTYGLVFLQRPPSLWRTTSKLLLAGCLALAARFADAPSLLALGLALCAAGDGLLAGDPKRLLTPGIAVFLLAHLVLTALFLEIGDLHRLATHLVDGAAALLGAAWCMAFLVRLWPGLGARKAPAAAYALALAATLVAAMTLAPEFRLAKLGAVLFVASDSILALRLFRYAGAPSRLWDHLVWWLYAAAITAIAWAFLHG